MLSCWCIHSIHIGSITKTEKQTEASKALMIRWYWHINKLWPRRRLNILWEMALNAIWKPHKQFSFMFASQFGRSHGLLIESLKTIYISHCIFHSLFRYRLSCQLYYNTYIRRCTHTHFLSLSYTYSSHTLASLWFHSFFCWPQLCRLLLITNLNPLQHALQGCIFVFGKKKKKMAPWCSIQLKWNSHTTGNTDYWKQAATVEIISAIKPISQDLTSLLVSPLLCITPLTQSPKLVGDKYEEYFCQKRSIWHLLNWWGKCCWSASVFST